MWTQRHVRIQLFIIVVVIALSVMARLEPLEVLFLFSAVAAVLIAELFNSAIEVVVNMITEAYHPLAKIAKDVAAGGVLIACVYAVTVGCTIFLDKEKIRNILGGASSLSRSTPTDPLVMALLILMGLLMVSILVIIAKVRKGHGSILRGGAVSGHTAVAFLLFGGVTIASRDPLISLLALFIAFLVAQSRVEGKIHTLAEVLWGALWGLIMSAILLILLLFVSS